MSPSSKSVQRVSIHGKVKCFMKKSYSAYQTFSLFLFPGYFYAALMFIALSARTILEAQYYGIKTYL